MMKKVLIILALVAVNLSSMAQQTMEQRIQLLEDRVALKHLYIKDRTSHFVWQEITAVK